MELKAGLSTPQNETMRQPEQKPVRIVWFHNFTTKPFTWKWANTPYTFAPGEKMKMEDWKAEHFAIHLVEDYVQSEEGKHLKLTGVRKVHGFKKLVESCIIPTEQTIDGAGGVAKFHSEMLNDDEPFEDVKQTEAEMLKEAQQENPEVAKKKIGRPKKVKEEFEGLKA